MEGVKMRTTAIEDKEGGMRGDKGSLQIRKESRTNEAVYKTSGHKKGENQVIYDPLSLS